MSKLPKIQHTIFETTLPSTGEKVKYRSFTSREEKTLLTAKETEDLDQILLSIKQVINNCLVDVDIDGLPMFDIEYLLLQLRARSVDNKVEFTIKDPDTEEKVELELDLDDVKLVKNENHSDVIKVDKNIHLQMRYPSWEEFGSFLKADSVEKSFEIVTSCIKAIYHNDEVIALDDIEQEDLDEFFNDMSSETIRDLRNFFDTIPVLRHEMKYTNSNGKEQTFVIEGINTFFL